MSTRSLHIYNTILHPTPWILYYYPKLPYRSIVSLLDHLVRDMSKQVFTDWPVASPRSKGQARRFDEKRRAREEIERERIDVEFRLERQQIGNPDPPLTSENAPDPIREVLTGKASPSERQIMTSSMLLNNDYNVEMSNITPFGFNLASQSPVDKCTRDLKQLFGSLGHTFILQRLTMSLFLANVFHTWQELHDWLFHRFYVDFRSLHYHALLNIHDEFVSSFMSNNYESTSGISPSLRS